MDAVEYVKQRNRMCDYYPSCSVCPAVDLGGCSTVNNIVRMIPIVEQWEKEHPVKTRQSEFLKQWPNAEIGDDGLPGIGPCWLNTGLICGDNQEACEDRGVCDKCRRDFWLKEIE